MTALHAALLLLLLLALPTQAAVTHRADLLPGSDGLWSVELRYPLASPLDERAWNATAANLTPGSLAGDLRGSLGAQSVLLSTARETSSGVVWVRLSMPGLLGTDGRFSGLPGGTPLGPGDSLIVGFPTALSAAYVYPPPDRQGAGELSWQGPRNFGPGEPLVRLEVQGSPLWAAAAGLAGVVAGGLLVLLLALRLRGRP